MSEESQEREASAETPVPEASPNGKKRRGFAVISEELRKEISRKGGRAAHAAGTAHEFTSEEARVAGRKGGYVSHAKRQARKAAGG